MNLNLGLESLSPKTVYRNTEINSTLFNACDATVGQLVTSIENLFDAAKNVIAVRNALKKYGRTQSIVALVGQEGLATAQTFSMEGFWKSAKELLVKIWTKIKEWWNRFWSIFFSNSKSMKELSRAGNKLSTQPTEYDGINVTAISKYLGEIEKLIPTLEGRIDAAANNSDGLSLPMEDDQKKSVEIHYMRVKLGTGSDVARRAGEIAQAMTKAEKLQKTIDKINDKALKAAQELKEEETQKTAVDSSKKLASYMRGVVQQVYQQLNTEAAKLKAHAKSK